jgi:hypothetical protein
MPREVTAPPRSICETNEALDTAVRLTDNIRQNLKRFANSFTSTLHGDSTSPVLVGEDASLTVQAQGVWRSKVPAEDAVDKLLNNCQSLIGWQGKGLDDIFNDMDTDHSGDLSAAEVAAVLKRLEVPIDGDEQAQRILEDLRGGGGTSAAPVGVEHLRRRIQLHAERRRLADRLNQDTDTVNLIARLLLPSDAPADNMESLSKIDTPLLFERLSPLLSQIVDAVKRVASDATQETATAGEKVGGANSKFSMDGLDGLRRAVYGDVALHRENGLNELIGWPSPNVFEAMKREHCDEDNSDTPFKVGNYGGDRYPRQEWEFVVAPQQGQVYPDEKTGTSDHGRERKDLEDLMKLEKLVAARVTREELIALRLYTGPLYMYYNDELRKALDFYLKSKTKNHVLQFKEGPNNVTLAQLVDAAILLGVEIQAKVSSENEQKEALAALLWEETKDVPKDAPRSKYVTTIHMITSCIVKLSGQTQCPDDRKVYRGVSGMRMPLRFFKANANGWRSLTEAALMSTTLKRQVALQYSKGGKKPIILEIQVGEIGCGADVGKFSQYPGISPPRPARSAHLFAAALLGDLVFAARQHSTRAVSISTMI